MLGAVVQACSTLFGECPIALFKTVGGMPVRVAAWADPPPELERLAARFQVKNGDRVWGWLGADVDPDLPDVQRNLAAVVVMVEAALASAEQAATHQQRLEQLADEQRALRTVAEHVGTEPTPQIFDVVAQQASVLLDGVAVTLSRYDGEQHLVVEASPSGPAQRGQRTRIEPGTLPDRIRITARPSRVDDYRGELDAELALQFGVAAAVAAPIVVGGQVWGQLTATSTKEPLPIAVESVLQNFAALVVGPLANEQARREVQALSTEHAAVRRVAERVANDAPAEEILKAIAHEAARLAGVDDSAVLRFLSDGGTEVVIFDGAPPITVGMRAPAGGDGAVQQAWRTGRAARADDLRRLAGHWPKLAAASGLHSSAVAPIHLDGAMWGVLLVVARNEPLPVGIEEHLSNFSELASTAIAAAQARRELQEMAKEQAALRRVAELVAHGVLLDEVFDAVVNEASLLLADRGAILTRFDDAGRSVVVTSHDESPVAAGLQLSKQDGAVSGVLRTGNAVRFDTYEGTALAEAAGSSGVAATVSVPVSVEGNLWGTLGAASSGLPLPSGAEQLLTHFADLTGAAIANAENKAKLTASRARVVAAADETRRRLQRDVHDTAQQRLVHAVIALQMARDAVAGGEDVSSLIAEALRNVQHANQDIRNIVRGILPAALTRGGLAAVLETLVDDLTTPVRLNVDVPRLPIAVETTAYFVAAEALANVTKHAGARQADVRAELDADGRLVMEIRDDGRGGAEATKGTGLTGLVDRVEAGGGTLKLISPPGAGTTVRVELPVSWPVPFPYPGPAAR